jgi:uncharacterized protein YprB with RNaseH-like and TPR domain
LIAEADTQALHGDIHGKKLAGKDHAQVVDGDEIKSSNFDEEVGRSIDDVAVTEIDERYQWNTEREYYHGWSEGTNVVLLYRTETGARKREVVPFNFYFFVDRKEADAKIPQEKWEWLVKRGWADRVVPDPDFPERYYRIYVERPLERHDKKRIFERIDFVNRKYSWATPLYLGEMTMDISFPVDRDKWKPFHELINWLQKKDVEPLEADLSPRQRFMTDYDLNIQAKYRTMFLDIETDDTIGGFDRKEKNRILSIAWQGDDFEQDHSDSGYLELEEETDAAEERMLRRLRDAIKPYDVLAAWNGFDFDFPVIFARFWKYNIRIDWRYWLFVDPLPIFRRHYIRAGADVTSFALDAVGQSVLKMPKLDWRSGFKKQFPGITPKMVRQYRADLLPDRLRVCERLQYLDEGRSAAPEEGIQGGLSLQNALLDREATGTVHRGLRIPSAGRILPERRGLRLQVTISVDGSSLQYLTGDDRQGGEAGGVRGRGGPDLPVPEVRPDRR